MREGSELLDAAYKKTFVYMEALNDPLPWTVQVEPK